MQTLRKNIPDKSSNITQTVDERFSDYHSCIDDAHAALAPCMKDLETLCRHQNFVSMKTARVSMRVAEKLLKRLPNLKIVHYMRDPRSISLSRLKHPSFRGLYTKKSITRTAQIFCQDALDDIQVKQKLVPNYPTTFMNVYFEEFALFPTLTANRIYHFLKAKLPFQVRTWLLENTKATGKYRTSQDSQKIVNDWKTKISKRDLEEVNKICAPLLQEVTMDWP